MAGIVTESNYSTYEGYFTTIKTQSKTAKTHLGSALDEALRNLGNVNVEDWNDPVAEVFKGDVIDFKDTTIGSMKNSLANLTSLSGYAETALTDFAGIRTQKGIISNNRYDKEKYSLLIASGEDTSEYDRKRSNISRAESEIKRLIEDINSILGKMQEIHFETAASHEYASYKPYATTGASYSINAGDMCSVHGQNVRFYFTDGEGHNFYYSDDGKVYYDDGNGLVDTNLFYMSTYPMAVYYSVFGTDPNTGFYDSIQTTASDAESKGLPTVVKPDGDTSEIYNRLVVLGNIDYESAVTPKSDSEFDDAVKNHAPIICVTGGELDLNLWHTIWNGNQMEIKNGETAYFVYDVETGSYFKLDGNNSYVQDMYGTDVNTLMKYDFTPSAESLAATRAAASSGSLSQGASYSVGGTDYTFRGTKTTSDGNTYDIFKSPTGGYYAYDQATGSMKSLDVHMSGQYGAASYSINGETVVSGYAQSESFDSTVGGTTLPKQ